MRVLRFEMTRAFRNKWLAVSIALGTLIGLADIWLNVSQYGFNRGRALIQTWIGTDYQFAYNSLFYVLLPLIACFPYAGSCYQDQKTGYESSICIKTSRLSYMIAKEAAVAASGAAAVACPLLRVGNFRNYSACHLKHCNKNWQIELYFAAFIFMLFQYTGQTMFKSLNKKKQAIFFSILRKVIIVVPLTYIFPYAMHMGSNGVFMAEPVSNVIGGSLCFIVMLLTVLPELKRMKSSN